MIVYVTNKQEPWTLRKALLEFIPLIDVSISIGTVEHKADIKD